MNTLKFTKMHGLGNDFMVVDATEQTFHAEDLPIIQWANRHMGIGFDQLLLIEPSRQEGVDFRYRIFNADGGEVEQCGNGARCFAKFVVDKGLTDKREIVVETAKGLIVLRLTDDGEVTVDMGAPRLNAAEIPFLPIEADEAADAVTHWVSFGLNSVQVSCVNMGNPHAVLVVDDVEQAPVAEWGAQLEPHEQFPERVNVGFMQVTDPHAIRLRVFERGTGETLACGTGACAAAVAGIRLGLLARDGAPVEVSLPGGVLHILWDEATGHVLMTGPATTVFEGEAVL